MEPHRVTKRFSLGATSYRWPPGMQEQVIDEILTKRGKRTGQGCCLEYGSIVEDRCVDIRDDAGFPNPVNYPIVRRSKEAL